VAAPRPRLHAAAAVVTFRAARFRKIDAEPRQESVTGRGDFPTAVEEHDVVAAQEHVAYSDATAFRDVVVTHSL
jgi:hypothetical protein